MGFFTISNLYKERKLMEEKEAAIKAYFKDRVQELRAQLPHKNPFLFIGANSVIESLASFGSDTAPTLYGDMGYSYNVYKALNRLSDTFCLNNDRIRVRITHDHVPEEDGVEIVGAEDFLNRVDTLIDTVDFPYKHLLDPSRLVGNR